MCFQTKQKCLIYFRIKKVQFSDERVEYLLPAIEDRRGPWMQMATDHAHFQRRIEKLKPVLESVLENKITLVRNTLSSLTLPSKEI